MQRKINNNKITVVRIGDQVLFPGYVNNEYVWFTPGYYQLKEISDMFGDRLASFTVFGRIMRGKNSISGRLYRIPSEVVPHFRVIGPQIKQKGVRSYLRVLPELFRKLRKATANHDVSWFMMPSMAGLIGSLVAPKRTLKVVQLVGEWSVPLRLEYPKFASIFVPVAEWLTRLALSHADLAVFVSSHLKHKYGKNIESQVIVANESRLRPWMIHEVNGKEFHKPLRILYIGRLVPEKGVQVLLKAIAILSKNKPYELWIVGDGPFEETLKIIAKELSILASIRWFGWVKWGEKLFRILRESDIFVLPSFGEGLPLTIVEAMSQGTPVIATRVGGIPEIVKDKISGILIEPGNPYAIVKAIQQIEEDTKLRIQLITEGLKIAKENTLERQTGEVINIIKKMLYDRCNG